VPADFGSRYLHSPLLSYVVILLISIPIYVCATGSIPIAASLIAKGVLPGAALALLIAGPATNTVTISFLFKKMGARITAIYITSIVVVSVVSGLLFDWIWQNMGLELGTVTEGGTHLPHFIKYLSAAAMLIIFINGKFDLFKFFVKFRTDTGDKDKMVYKINVPDMNCQHCKMKITSVLKNLPEIQSVSIDLAAREVEVESSLDRQQVIHHIKEEGYHPS
jgi:copper chaperone CopZ